MNKYILVIIIMFFSGESSARKIYKCILDNGTISYQKTPCIEDESTILENIQKTKNKKQKEKNKMSNEQLESFFKKNVVAHSIKLKSHVVSVVKLKQWRAFDKILGDNTVHIKFLDETLGSEMSLLMDFILIAPDKSFNTKDLTEEMNRMGKSFLVSSTQSQVTPVKVNVNDGIGVIAVFTDKNLVNKSTYPPGEYLHTIKGLVFKDGFLIHVTLLSNDLEGLNQIMALQSFISGVEITKVNSSKTGSSSDPLDKPFENLYNGNKRESVAMFEEVIQQEPNNFSAWMGYCIALRDTNRLQSAFIACDKAMSLDPKNIEVYVSLINLYTKSRVWKQGLEFIESTIQITNNAALLDSITNFGYFSMLDNDTDTADKVFNIAKSLGNASDKLKVDMSIIKYRKGDITGAKLDIKNILEANPGNKFAYAIDYKMGQNEKLVFPFANPQSYMNVPDRLKRLGKGININQKPDNWVQKVFTVSGVGYIKIDVPENWYERTQIIQTDESNDEISITLVDFETFTSITIDIGKVGNDWGLEQINKQLTSSLSLYFDLEDIKLNPMAFNKVGYSFSETKSRDEKVPWLISAQQELKSNLSIKSFVVKRPIKNRIPDKTQRVINSIIIDNLDDAPLKIAKSSVVKKGKKPANDTELPDAPNGFSWIRMPKAMAAFVKPDGWFTKNKSTKDAFIYTISKESVDVNGSFETGLTVQALRNLELKKGISPSVLALQMLKGLEDSPDDTIINTKNISQGDFISFFVRYVNSPSVLKPITIHKVFIANEKTGSLYIMIFESPKDIWEQSWEIGEVMMKYFLVDDEF